MSISLKSLITLNGEQYLFLIHNNTFKKSNTFLFPQIIIIDEYARDIFILNSLYSTVYICMFFTIWKIFTKIVKQNMQK